jgi:molecular chaperone GrpE
MSKPKKQEKVEYVPEENLSTEALAKAEKLKKKLKSCEKERAEYLAGWQRAKADLINYKKEQEQKNSAFFKFANETLISEILPVLDSFEQAMKHSKDEGTLQLYNQLKSILKNQGLEEIESMGKKFNPEFHEAVEEIKGKKGIIIKEVQKGYILNKKLIRPSKVKVGK